MPLYWEDGPYNLAGQADQQNEGVAMTRRSILFDEPVEVGGGIKYEPIPKSATPVIVAPPAIQLGWRGMLFITVGAGALAWGFWTLWPVLQRSFSS